MEEWYIPITILPGICLLVLSTSHIMTDLSNELRKLIKEKKSDLLVERKLKQLKLINRAMVFLYLSAALFVVSGLVSGISILGELSLFSSPFIVILGILSALLALLTLVTYSHRAVRIRQDQYHNNC